MDIIDYSVRFELMTTTARIAIDRTTTPRATIVVPYSSREPSGMLMARLQVFLERLAEEDALPPVPSPAAEEPMFLDRPAGEGELPPVSVPAVAESPLPPVRGSSRKPR